MTAPSKSSVYISAVQENAAWVERITDRLRRDGISVWGHTLAFAHLAAKTEVERSREHCGVYILLLSVRYLDSDVIRRSELPSIQSLPTAEARIIYVIAERCYWESVLPLHVFATIPADGSALFSGEQKQIEANLSALTQLVRRAVEADVPKRIEEATQSGEETSMPEALADSGQVDHVRKKEPLQSGTEADLALLREFSFSRTVRKVLKQAEEIASGSKGSMHSMSPSTLFFAMVEIGRRSEPVNAAYFLYKWITSNPTQNRAYQGVYTQFLAEKVDVDIDTSLLLVAETAESIGQQTSSSRVIHARHLLAALLGSWPGNVGLRASLVAGKVDLSQLLREFLDFLSKDSTNNMDAWRSVLGLTADTPADVQSPPEVHKPMPTVDLPLRKPLVQLCAARLTAKTRDGEQEAMATLVSPLLAAIPFRWPQEGGFPRGANVEILLWQGSPPRPRRATILASDEGRDFSVLRLEGEGVPVEVSIAIRGSDPPLGARWQSCFFQQEVEFRTQGNIQGRVVLNRKRYLQLKVSGPFPGPGISGAPVVVEDQLIGIVSHGDQKAGMLYAVSVVDMAKSEETAAIRALMPKAKPPEGEAPEAERGEFVDQKTFDRYSPNARSTLARAMQLAKDYKRRRIHIEHLLLALAEQPHSQLSDLLTSSKLDLMGTMAPRLGLTDVPQPGDAPGEIEGFPPISSNTRRALTAARQRADADHCATIQAAHILYGALSTTRNESIRALNGKGITPERIKLPTGFAEEDGAETVLAGYQSDDPTGEDLLDIRKEVEALASVMAAKDVAPPLSLGLFGDWGTGKSFFMQKLEARINELQEDAKKASGESAYCRNIVQIPFNAWNYIDCNLWASLTSEIFEKLAGAIAKERGKESAEERALVLAAASSARTVLEEAEKKKIEAEEELRKTDERLAALEKSEAEIEASLNPRELIEQAVGFAMQDEKVKEDVNRAAKAFHVAEGMAAAHEVRTEILELRDTWSSLFFTLRNDKRLWLWVVALAGGLGLGWYVNRVAMERFQAEAFVRHAIALLSSVSTFLAPFLYTSRRAMAYVQKAKASKEALVEQKKRELAGKRDEQRKSVQKKVEAARDAVKEASAKVKKLNEQLEEMRADRRMADYIRRRHESTDYTQHLGIIARVRADFRHLSTLLREVREEDEQEEADADGGMKQRQMKAEKKRQDEGKPPLFPPIDRIVLYIDDLDRCPERNVVEVLQAVHLLLAFPLFVVVVGVDPRWLLHSLQQYSRVFQNSEETENGNARASEEDWHWRSTPLNYLEKIFQIPFSLRPITKEGFGKLVDTFAKVSAKRQGNGAAAQVRGGGESVPTPVVVTTPASGAARTVVPRGDSETPTPSPTPQETVQKQLEVKTELIAPPEAEDVPAIDRHPEHLMLREWEQTFMKELHEFIPTPRAAKRFINIYRLLRASVDDEEHASFIGSEKGGVYRAAMLLLAIQTGYPAQATEILERLIKEEPKGTWWEFVDSFKASMFVDKKSQRDNKTAKTNDSRVAVGSADSATVKAITPSEVDALLRTELFGKLNGLKEVMADRSCKSFCGWAPRVARYSFQSGRVLSYRRGRRLPA